MPISFGNISTYVGTSAGTSKSYTHTRAANTNLLIVRVCLRGATVNPTNVSVTVNGASASLAAGSAAINTSNRSYVAFFMVPDPPEGSLSIVVSWTGTANIVSTAIDAIGASGAIANSWTTIGSSTSASLNVTCPTDGAVLDSISANNGRVFTANNITPHYDTLATNTGSNDVCHRAGKQQTAGALTIGWTISTSSNYAYSAIAISPSAPTPDHNGFLMFFK